MLIPQFLNDQGVNFETLFHAPAYTAPKRAKYLHVPGNQVAKCVLLAGPRGFLLAVLASTQQVDTEALSLALEGPVRLATRDEIAQVFCDCEWGVVSPFGTLYGLETLLECSLTPDTLIVFEGNMHGVAIRLRCMDFERLEKPRRLSFARHAS